MIDINYVEELQRIIDEEITPCFQSNGFKKNGNSFYRENGDLIGVCSIQRSRDNSQIFARFTFNIKLSMPLLFQELEMREKKKINCVVFDMTLSGILHLLGTGINSESWYTLADAEQIGCYKDVLSTRYDTSDILQVKKIIKDDINNIIVPFFENTTNVDDVANLINRKGYYTDMDRVFLIKYYFENGDKDSSEKIIKGLSDLDDFSYSWIKEKTKKYTERV